MKNVIRACALLAISGGGCMNMAFGKGLSEKKINHYSLQIPHDYRMRDITPPMMDFELYEVHKVGNPKVKFDIYFGNNPSFPKFKWKEESLNSTKDNCSTKVFKYRKSDGAIEGLLSYSGLSYKGSNQSPYTTIHYFASGLSEKEADVLLGIISSIKVVKPNLN
jgi:hypothetical protein